MIKMTVIKLEIESISPLNIKNDDQDLLFSEEENAAYLPATSIAGSFRSYLKWIGEEPDKLFGRREENADSMSKVLISDAYAQVSTIESRIGIAIDSIYGTAKVKEKSLFKQRYLGAGLKFELGFKIQFNANENIDGEHFKDEFKLKDMLYKCIKGLYESHIRFGGNKSNGLGCFKVNWVKEINFNLGRKDDWVKYLNNDLSNARDILSDILKINTIGSITEIRIKGEFSTPLLIGAPSSFDLDAPDTTSIHSGGSPIVPGSSFKGALRARMEKIASFLGQKDIVDEFFGGPIDGNEHFLSNVMVSESKLEHGMHYESHNYNRIKTDKFTGGTFNTALMNDLPVKGKTEFLIVYRKKGEEIDNCAVGLLGLALRDLGTENMAIGGGESIGRGRFRAEKMVVKDEEKIISIDFINKSIDGKEILQRYIDSIKTFKNKKVVGK